ncbi:hypothetical protein VB796_22950 [Arcicella sp. LKC2W]|uniref:hypothetical protein n=1 Tax=Arcicella sp. LKC2W TaxID=2984198 RepID=UPI002B1F1111|nr:hypothetical protein [Arcicella sp. LKC2W]MEA5461947.1 hypothetical protein [Arcicella sp. LKC2W]
MNNSFNYTRFSLLVKRQWVENKKLFLMASFALWGLGVICYSLGINWEMGHISDAVQPMYFIGSLFIGGTFFTNYIFKDFSDKNASTNFLLIPASHLEKLLSACFYCFIVLPIVFSTLFFIIDYFFVNFANSVHESLVLKNHLHDESWKDNELWYRQLLEKTNIALKSIIGAWFIAQTIMMIGSMMFIRWSYIKTAFVAFAIIFSLAILSNYVFDFFVGEFDKLAEGSKRGIFLQVEPTKDFLKMLTGIAIKFIFTPILLLIAFLKLKEKQV